MKNSTLGQASLAPIYRFPLLSAARRAKGKHQQQDHNAADNAPFQQHIEQLVSVLMLGIIHGRAGRVMMVVVVSHCKSKD
jgi:hypothetical protein